MKYKHWLLACLLTAAALAQAAPVAEVGSSKRLGAGTGTYSFSAKQETAFWVSLAPGTYTFTLSAFKENGDSNVTAAWLSLSNDSNPNNGNDFSQFNVSNSGLPGSFTETITVPRGVATKVYLNVLGTNLEKGRDGDVAGFSGTFNVSSVPEPDSAVLLLAGLGLMGAMVRRRKLQG